MGSWEWRKQRTELGKTGRRQRLPARVRCPQVLAAKELAGFGFEDIMFVDVGVYLQNGERAMNRTLVIKDRDAKWYVHPAPSVSPLLSEGLNEEEASVRDFADAYEVER